MLNEQMRQVYPMLLNRLLGLRPQNAVAYI
jgi:hypothetical protein